MKLISVIVFLFSFHVYSQTDTCFTEKQIHQISNYIDSLSYTDSVKNDLIDQMSYTMQQYEQYMKLDSMEISYLTQQNVLKDENISLYQRKVELYQDKWYDRPWVWFLSGSLSTAIIVYLVK